MSKFARITALLLILAMLPAVYVYAENEQESSAYASAIEKLCALGFAQKDEDGLFYPENDITRAEFTAMAVKVTGYDKNVKTGTSASIFEDVRDDMWYTPYVVYAAEQGIAAGYGSRRFYPDESINANEAVKILTSAMGYKEFSESNGGYPSGYVQTARRLGLYDRVPVSDISNIKRGEAAQMCVNALEAEILINTSTIGADEYTKIKLMEHLGLISEKAVLTQSGRRAIKKTQRYDSDEVIFSNGTVCKRNGINTAELVGYRVEYIYKEAERGSDDNILMYIEKSASNKEITIDAADITEVSARSITVEDDNGRQKKYNISKNVDIVFNGSAVESFSEDILMPKQGYLTLIANDGGEYNVIFTESYINVYVGGKNISEYEIFDKYDITKVEQFKEEDDNEVRITDTSGGEMSFSDIAPGDVVSVFRSQDKRTVRAVVARSNFSGTVTEIDEEELYIDGDAYEMTKELLGYIAMEDTPVPQISTGAKVTVYADCMGYIAAYIVSMATDRRFAYMKSFRYYDDGEEGVKVQLFTQDGEHESIECAEKVRIDGTNYKKTQGVRAGLEQLPRYDGLVVYQLDEQGKLNYLDTVNMGENETGETLFKVNAGYSLNAGEYVKSGSEMTYKDKSMSFDMKVLLTGSTPVFQVPTKDIKDAPEDYFTVKTAGDFVKDQRVCLDTYKIDTESYYTEAAVIYSSSSAGLAIDNESNPAVVSKVFETIVGQINMVCATNNSGGTKDRVIKFENGKLTAAFGGSITTPYELPVNQWTRFDFVVRKLSNTAGSIAGQANVDVYIDGKLYTTVATPAESSKGKNSNVCGIQSAKFVYAVGETGWYIDNLTAEYMQTIPTLVTSNDESIVVDADTRTIAVPYGTTEEAVKAALGNDDITLGDDYVYVPFSENKLAGERYTLVVNEPELPAIELNVVADSVKYANDTLGAVGFKTVITKAEGTEIASYGTFVITKNDFADISDNNKLYAEGEPESDAYAVEISDIDEANFATVIYAKSFVQTADNTWYYSDVVSRSAE